ncbi:spore coat U domain-containing protein [Acinetobacter baumannii]
MMRSKIFSLLVFGLLGAFTQQTFANCTTLSSSLTLGPISSFNVPSLNSTDNQISGGLSCSGTLTLFSNQYIQYTALNIPSKLIHTDGKNSANITILDYDKNIVITSSKPIDLTRFVVISFFSGPNSSIPFYIRVNENTNLVPGTYKGQFLVKWFWRIPYLGIGGISLYYNSPNLKTNLLGNITDWGTGQDAIINIELIVEKDCKINAQNINFGTAPLVSKFNPVTGTVQITCSAQPPYTVGLSNGQNYSQNRRMKNVSGNQYIPYEIYKNTTTQRWGYLGTDRWSSSNASQNAGIYDGSVTQGYSYTAKIIDDGSNASAEGTYKDNLILEVAF